MVYYQLAIPDHRWLQLIRQNIAAEDHCVLLESCDIFAQQNCQDLPTDKNHHDADEKRFSIYAIHAEFVVEFFDGMIRCEQDFIPTPLLSKPFEALKYILAKFPAQAASPLPFEGGFIGYLSYDLGRSLERMPTVAIADIDLPEMKMSFFSIAIVIDHHNQMLNIVGIEDHQQQADNLKNWLEQLKAKSAKSFTLLSDWQSNISEKDYHAKFSQVQEYIHAGDCYQINLAQRWHATFSGDSWLAYEQLAEKNAAPFSSYLRYGKKAILSLSPERFIACAGKQCQTKPIKGTRPRGENAAADRTQIDELSNSSKDRSENVMIVDLLRNDLSKVCRPQSVKVENLFQLESFPAVHHLVSTIKGVLEPDKQPLDLLKAAFPGGSITGVPKIRAMEIIEELEPHRRSIYCGSIAYMGCNGKMDSNIAIRTLVCDKSNIYCWAGGGLVADSRVDEEYAETQHKVAKILPELTPNF